MPGSGLLLISLLISLGALITRPGRGPVRSPM
jgi:hypothetical protein